ncbi:MULTISPECIES: YjbH domain-containing protein [unclassified Yoonia]|uniref:YjbH domain-containing protein n=1 Tax=unclassified Yoonia TaxID=2629118 RepID=UPI002AFE2098|nr:MULTISPECIES: YjbH domain-containing protein [unclassified Yoonia]
MSKRIQHLCACVTFGAFAAPLAMAQTGDAYVLNTYGMPGIATMPSAAPLPDAEFVTSIAIDDNERKYTLTFQVTPRLTAAFRYSLIDEFRDRGRGTADRSFDVQYQLLDETGMRPAVAIGLRDFIGTGLYSGEYVVASKQITPDIVATAGIGWGALGTRNGFDNPLGQIDDRFNQRSRAQSLGGELTTTQWFRGEAALFAGATWQVDDRLALAAEYSSDARDLSARDNLGDDTSGLNFGISYAVQPDITLGLQYLQGDTVAASAHFALNPRRPAAGGDLSSAAIPFAPRDGSAQRWAGPMIQDAIPESARTAALAAGLAAEGIVLQAIAMSSDSVLVQIRNDKFNIQAQAIGRTARLLSLTMPASIAQFDIELTENSVPLSRVTLQRADLERLEYQPNVISDSLAASVIGPAEPPDALVSLAQPRLVWGIGPYVALSFFDPDDPLRADLGLEATASYFLTPSLSVSGALRGKIIGNRDQSTRESDSVLPRVRSEQPLYDRDGTYGVERLTVDHFGKIGPDLYTRTSFGYLETMFAGLSGEILWKPVESRLALGAELNAVMQRDTDKLFGFDDYDYGVTTGHLSAYYALENGFDFQVDVGRYLAGDWGTTISLDRRFGNGWVVGGYATFTDVSFEDFGEGSFDKGIRLTVPLSWGLGTPTRDAANINLQPLQRDGGARLNVNNRLYPAVRDAHAPELSDQWGRFWR